MSEQCQILVTAFFFKFISVCSYFKSALKEHVEQTIMNTFPSIGNLGVSGSTVTCEDHSLRFTLLALNFCDILGDVSLS